MSHIDKIVKTAIKNNDLELLKILDNRISYIDSDTQKSIVKSGYTDILKWAMSNNLVTLVGLGIMAIKENQFQCFKILYEGGNCIDKEKHLNEAIKSNNMDIIIYI